ncbi:ATP-binding protein [Paenibacillus mesotrionivorans]|uniref:ATP-binding protein n=1 Tax=Paenibacillus mesotrionivorans TaxID=3160968 RepID=A0ACC7P5C8_9BACL
MDKLANLHLKVNWRLPKYLALIILFVGLMQGVRWVWTAELHVPKHPKAAAGTVDLSGWDFSHSPSITLDGEWEFYPGQLLTQKDIAQGHHKDRMLLQVPVEGQYPLEVKEGPDSFGYGTYRLLIRVDPTLNLSYGFWIGDVRTSSTLEINGKVVAEAGRVGTDRGTYVPSAATYMSAASAEGSDTLELIIRYANFDDSLNGGIVKSIRFGSQSAVTSERFISVGLQLGVVFIALLHCLYGFILYLFDRRQQALRTFGVMMLMAALTVVLSDDVVILELVAVPYAWLWKIKLLAYMWMSFFMIQLGRTFLGKTKQNKIFVIYTLLVGLYSVFILVAPMTLVHYSIRARVHACLYVLPVVWFGGMLFRAVWRNDKDAVFLVFSMSCLVSNVVWSVISYSYTAKHIYYPVNLIGAMIGFSCYWFKKYFHNAAENERLNRQLNAASKEKDRFLAQTSHELRNPLHGMMNIAQAVTAREKNKLEQRSFEDMELMRVIGKRMASLLDDLLDMARLQDHRISLQPKPVSLLSVISGVWDMLRHNLEGKPVRFVMDVPESLPPVWADEKRLTQSLYNLLHNAVKFTQEGDIRVSASVRKGMAAVEITDTGTGMDEEMQLRIFREYEQSKEGAELGGIGLGLTIAKQLIELHGGEITVRSQPGLGSSFQFTLPLATLNIKGAAIPSEAPESLLGQEQQTVADVPVQGIQPNPPALLSEKPVRILAVDDDSINLKVLSSVLSSGEYRITTVQKPEDMLRMLDKEAWDILIVDVMMPQMSGYELTRLVRERYDISELPILLLTARNQPEDIYTGFLAGANDYLVKPVDALELKYRLWSLARLKRSISEGLRMEAAYLQAQISPHFLYNTLNSLLALSEMNKEKMQELGEAFISYLRISVDFLNMEQLVPLEHELELVRAYLYIEQARFGSRLSVDIDMNMDRDIFLPPLSLQPLVENAVKHGMTGRKLLNIHVRISREEDEVLLEVRDNGRGMPAGEMERLLDFSRQGRRGIGLLNTNRRLIQLYGKGLNVESAPEQGTKVWFRVPWNQPLDN